MDDNPNQIHSETDAARAGSTPHIVRWVLGISLFAAIALLSIIWITGAGMQGEPESTAEVRARALQDYGGQGGVLASEGDQAQVSEASGGGATEVSPSPTAQATAAATASPAPAN